MEHLFAAILAGGTGQRFWPLSREMRPKQLLSVFGQESLIAQAVRRVGSFLDDRPGSVLIVTGEALYDELRNHLSAEGDARLSAVDYLVEPVGRNTAPAIALAAAYVASKDPEASIIVLPSDHLLDDGQVWHDTLTAAAKLAADGYLVTIGIKPTRAETGYGYIRGGQALEDYVVGAATPLAAESFVEKPDSGTAHRFVGEGTYFWNAGIFVLGAEKVLAELTATGEDARRIVETARWLASVPRDQWAGAEARERFGSLTPISIDKALMEKADRVAVVPADLEWSDVGSLLALEGIAERDECANVRVGRGVDVDTEDTVVYSAGRLIATLGVSGLLVVDTSDATLVAAKDRAQDVRQVVDALKALGADEVVQHRESLRPWGQWSTLLKTASFHIKLVELKPKARLSLQKHLHRSEHWVVVSGTALVTREDEQVEVHANESIYIPVGVVHRLENCGKLPLKVIEVQVGEYLEEDDIVRIEDDWDREKR